MHIMFPYYRHTKTWARSMLVSVTLSGLTQALKGRKAFSIGHRPMSALDNTLYCTSQIQHR